MMIPRIALLLLFLLSSLGYAQEAEAPPAVEEPPVITKEYDVKDVAWETNLDDPPIGDPERAIRGGTFRDYITGYPKTWRTYGPNQNELWANWRRAYMQMPGLILRHPQTDNYIPMLATHWSIQDDHRTVFYKLDPTAHWNDGVPITAQDYVFAFEAFQNPKLLDPFVLQYVADYLESVTAIDDHTIKIVGKKPSWRPLEDYGIEPLPRHDMKIDDEWTVRDNYKVPVTSGPYVIDEERCIDGQRMELVRLKDWWGDNNRYLRGMYNPDRMVITVFGDPDRAFDSFKLGGLDYYSVNTARTWATQMNFPELTKNWVRQRELYMETPEGFYGISMNLNAEIFRDKDFRKALQYMFNFDSLNDQLMFNAYYQSVSAFEGTMYENKDLKAYGFNPAKAREHLRAAGYTRRGSDGILVKELPEEIEKTHTWWTGNLIAFFAATSLLAGIFSFTGFRRNIAIPARIAFVLLILGGFATVGIAAAMKPQPQRAAFTLSYGQRGLERHLTVVQNDFRRAGIEMKLQLLESATFFERVRERATEAFLISMTAGFYPAPHQYFSSEFADQKQTNNFWSYSNKEVDRLIDTYRFNMDENERMKAMYRLDEILQDEAFHIHFWSAPFMRFLYWDHIEFPQHFFPKRAEQYMEFPTFWINPEKQKRLEQAQAANQPLPPDPIPVQYDPHDVKPR